MTDPQAVVTPPWAELDAWLAARKAELKAELEAQYGAQIAELQAKVAALEAQGPGAPAPGAEMIHWLPITKPEFIERAKAIDILQRELATDILTDEAAATP